MMFRRYTDSYAKQKFWSAVHIIILHRLKIILRLLLIYSIFLLFCCRPYQYRRAKPIGSG